MGNGGAEINGNGLFQPGGIHKRSKLFTDGCPVYPQGFMLRIVQHLTQ
jgi:hypothetical protein